MGTIFSSWDIWSFFIFSLRFNSFIILYLMLISTFQSKLPFWCGKFSSTMLLIIISVLGSLLYYLKIISLWSIFLCTKFSLFNLCFPQCCSGYLLFLMLILLGMVGWLMSIHSINPTPWSSHEVCVFNWPFSQLHGWNVSDPRQPIKHYPLGFTGSGLDSQSDLFQDKL